MHDRLTSRTVIFDLEGRLSTFVMFLLIVAVVVHAAFIFDVLWPAASYTAYIVQLAVVGFSLFFLVGSFHYGVVLGGIGLFAYLVAQQLLFARVTGTPPNLNAVASFTTILVFVPFCRSRVSVVRMLRMLALAVTIYLAIYVFLHDAILGVGSDGGHAVLVGDAERPARLYLAAAFASFVFFYALLHPRLWIPARVLMLALPGWAIWISGSRTFQVLFVVFTLLSTFRLVSFRVRLALFAAVMVSALVLLAGLVVPGFNPFTLVAGDGSAFARMKEYDVAIATIRDHWMFGIGIPGTGEALENFLKTPHDQPLYPTDLGALGPLVLFGLPGLAAFIAATWLAVMVAPRGVAPPEVQALRLNCMLCGMMGLISPSIIMEANVVFLALVIAWKVRNEPGRPREHSGEAGSLLWFRHLPRGVRHALQARFGRTRP